MRNDKKIIFSLFSLLLLFLGGFFAGCIQKSQPTATPTLTPTAGYPVTVMDSAGRKVTLEKVPERVIITSSYWAEVLHCLGLDDKIVGIDKYTPRDQFLPESVRQRTQIGSVYSGINWETVASLNPDLIVMGLWWGSFEPKEEKVIEKARELRIPILAFGIPDTGKTGTKMPYENIRIIRVLGKVFGKEERAEELASFLERYYNKALEIAKKIPEDKRKNVLIVYGSSIAGKYATGMISVSARGSAYAETSELVGAHNLAFDYNFTTPYPKFDLEKLIAYFGNKTYVLVVVDWEKDRLREAVEKIKSDSRWHEIRAVKEGNVVGVLVSSYYKDATALYGPRFITGIYAFGHAIYPEYYPDWKPIAKELLERFYGEKYYPITVTDFEGRKVTINKPPERIVILASQIAELLYCWGDFDKIVGITKWAKYHPILTELTDVGNVTDVGSGSSPNVEEIISLKPDLVITYGGEKGYSTPKEAVNKLEKAGIPVVLVDLYNISDLYRSIEIVGKIMNEEEKAEETVNYMKSVINMVKEEASKIPEEKRIKAIWTWSSPTRVTGNEGVTNDLIVNAGAVNAGSEVKGRYVTVPLEKIIEWNPDVIVIWEYAWKSGRYGPEDLIKDPRWKDVNAIKNKRVYKQPELLKDTFSIRVAVLQAWMFDKFYPGRIDFYKVANDFFERFYGVSYEELEKRLEKG